MKRIKWIILPIIFIIWFYLPITSLYIFFNLIFTISEWNTLILFLFFTVITSLTLLFSSLIPSLISIVIIKFYRKSWVKYSLSIIGFLSLLIISFSFIRNPEFKTTIIYLSEEFKENLIKGGILSLIFLEFTFLLINLFIFSPLSITFNNKANKEKVKRTQLIKKRYEAHSTIKKLISEEVILSEETFAPDESFTPEEISQFEAKLQLLENDNTTTATNNPANDGTNESGITIGKRE